MNEVLQRASFSGELLLHGTDEDGLLGDHGLWFQAPDGAGAG
jgi:hypothetical protein